MNARELANDLAGNIRDYIPAVEEVSVKKHGDQIEVFGPESSVSDVRCRFSDGSVGHIVIRVYEAK